MSTAFLTFAGKHGTLLLGGTDDARLMAAADSDISGQELQNIGNGGSSTVYRLREGVERFLITDINNPAASAQAQSSVFVMLDHVANDPQFFNHIPGGCNVLYMDGHVSFVRYQQTGGTAPVIGSVANIAGILLRLMNNPNPDSENWFN